MIKRIAGLAAATALLATGALAQGANVNNTVGVWGVNSSTGAPCLIAPVGATGTPSCVLPSQPPTGGAATVTANQGTAGASPWLVTPSQTGFNVSQTPTIQNASYVSGNCMGGFQTVALGTVGSVLSQVSVSSKGGLATSKQVYIFSANPTASTCTDKSTFTLAAADVSKLMISVSVSPAAPTGTTVTTGYASNLSLGVPSGGTIYVGVVETTTETPASTTDIVLGFSGY